MVQMNLFTGQEWRRKQQARVRGNTADGMSYEIRMDIYTLPCVKQMASVN